MERLHRIAKGTTPYLVLAALAVIAWDRATQAPVPAAETIVKTVQTPGARVTESRVVHVFDDRRSPAEPIRVEAPDSPGEEDENDDPEAEPDEAEVERRAERIERGHRLVDAMIDRGVAEPADADELRGIVAQLSHRERVPIYGRITQAVNDDELEVDPDHLPL